MYAPSFYLFRAMRTALAGLVASELGLHEAVGLHTKCSRRQWQLVHTLHKGLRIY